MTDTLFPPPPPVKLTAQTMMVSSLAFVSDALWIEWKYLLCIEI